MSETIVIKVVKSACNYYKEGDEIVINGPFLDLERSVNVCLTALHSIYPFIFAMRKGVTAKQLGFEKVEVQCPDYCAPVVFELQKEE